MIAFFFAEVLTISARKLETLGTFLAAVVKSFRLWAQRNQETLQAKNSIFHLASKQSDQREGPFGRKFLKDSLDLSLILFVSVLSSSQVMYF